MILLILFLPVAIYLIWVGGISRQSRPSIVGGSWDFVSLMFAGSGFVLAGLPAVITSIYETWRRYWLTGEGPIPFASLEGSRWFWIAIWMMYFVMVICLSAIFIYRRRCWTCFYNVESAAFESAVADALAQSGFQYRKFGNLYILHNAEEGAEERMEVEVFSFLSHGTIFFNKPESLLSKHLLSLISQELINTYTPHHWGGLLLMFLGFFVMFFTVIGQLATAILAR